MARRHVAAALPLLLLALCTLTRAAELAVDASGTASTSPAASTDDCPSLDSARAAASSLPAVEERIASLVAASEACMRRRSFDTAAQLRMSALTLRESIPSSRVFDLILDLTFLAQARSAGREYLLALHALEHAENLIAGRDNATLAVLLKARSSVLACMGNMSDAAATMNNALMLERVARGGARVKSDDFLMLLKLLTHALDEVREKEAGVDAFTPPRGYVEALRAQLKMVTAQLMKYGTWKHPQQLPRYFVPELASQPWYDAYVDLPAVRDMVTTLEAMVPELRDEYSKLKSSGALRVESECIQALGTWSYFTVTTDGAEALQETAPAAVALLGALTSVAPPGVRLHRVSYSAVSPGTHLRRHYGLSNAQLKLHAALIIPVDERGHGCATLTVANETKTWSPSGPTVWMFDDSWEHEVWNRCAEERVVMQVVFSHPGLADGRMHNPFQSALGKGSDGH